MKGGKNMVDKKQVPTGVKVISVLYYIGAFLGVIFGILSIFGAGMISSVASKIPLIGVMGSVLFIIVGVILLCLGILSFFVARGLWKAKNWARIVAIIFSCLGIVMAIISMISGNVSGNIFNLLIQLVIGGYLLFNNKVKEAFD